MVLDKPRTEAYKAFLDAQAGKRVLEVRAAREWDPGIELIIKTNAAILGRGGDCTKHVGTL